MPYFEKLKGDRCYLSPIDMEDAEVYTRWLNDLEVTENLTLSHMNHSMVSERKALERLVETHTYGIVARDGDTLIGNCGLLNHDVINATAEVGIFIGAKEFWGKGYGTEALRLLVEFAFLHLNLNSVMLRVFAYNSRAISCYQSMGFHQIGIRRQAIRKYGGYHDVIYMDLLAADYKMKYLQAAPYQDA